MTRSINRRDPYTGESLEQPHWMHQPAGERMPFTAGRLCASPSCGQELSRYDRGPLCWPCHTEQQRRAAEEAVA